MSLSQNQPCQQGLSITMTERFHPQRPFTVVVFETWCWSRSCSTLFKYFKWVRCGAITWLMDMGCVLCLLAAEHTNVLWGCSRSPSTTTSQTTLLLFLMLHKPLRNKRSLSSLCCPRQWPWKGRCMTQGSEQGEEKWGHSIEVTYIYIAAHPLQPSPPMLHNQRCMCTHADNAATHTDCNKCLPHTHPGQLIQMTASSLWANLKKQRCRTCHWLFCSHGWTCINYECEQMRQSETKQNKTKHFWISFMCFSLILVDNINRNAVVLSSIFCNSNSLKLFSSGIEIAVCDQSFIWYLIIWYFVEVYIKASWERINLPPWTSMEKWVSRPTSKH